MGKGFFQGHIKVFENRQKRSHITTFRKMRHFWVIFKHCGLLMTNIIYLFFIVAGRILSLVWQTLIKGMKFHLFLSKTIISSQFVSSIL